MLRWANLKLTCDRNHTHSSAKQLVLVEVVVVACCLTVPPLSIAAAPAGRCALAASSSSLDGRRPLGRLFAQTIGLVKQSINSPAPEKRENKWQASRQAGGTHIKGSRHR